MGVHARRFLDGHAVVEADRGRDVGDFFAGAVIGFFAVIADGTMAGVQDSGHGPEQGGFSGAVGSGQQNAFSLFNGQAQVVDRPGPAETDAEFVNRDHCLSRFLQGSF